MMGLKDDFGISFLYITHDLSTAFQISDNIVIFYEGSVSESGDAETVIKEPKHPYTQALLSAEPIPDPIIEQQRQRIILEGDVPSPANPPVGCNFNTRCPAAIDICFEEEPEFKQVPPERWVACHLVE